jgi:preprotein translocase subunit SecG
MLSGLLITVDILVCVSLIGVVLLQRSEGGGLGMGSGPTGLITARGAADLLTRTTWILFGLFLAISLGLTLLAAHDRANSSLMSRLKLNTLPAPAQGPALPASAPAPAATLPTTPGPTASPFLAPQAPAPVQTMPAAALPTQRPQPPAHAARAVARPVAAAPVAAAPAPEPATAPAPAAETSAQAAPAPSTPPAGPPAPRLNLTPPAPKADPNAPISTGTP